MFLSLHNTNLRAGHLLLWRLGAGAIPWIIGVVIYHSSTLLVVFIVVSREL